MPIEGNKANKGTKYYISITHTFSSDDTGDGVIHADGGEKYYYIGTGGTGSLDLFVRVGDVARISRPVTIPGQVTPPPVMLPGEAANPGDQVYTVKENDTLSEIALHFYHNGDRDHYMAIFNANRNILANPKISALGSNSPSRN